MKWIGQHIYDLVARFRNDVYLEDLSTTTETNVLVVDSDGKVSKTTVITGDVTGVTAGSNITVTTNSCFKYISYGFRLSNFNEFCWCFNR
jgi:uncharacterized protein YjdB